MTKKSYQLLVVLAAMIHFPLRAQETFNIHAFELDSPAQRIADLSLFTQPASQPPGIYPVTVYINGELQRGTKNIQFVSNNQGQLSPQLTPAMLQQWGLILPHFTHRMTMFLLTISTTIYP